MSCDHKPGFLYSCRKQASGKLGVVRVIRQGRCFASILVALSMPQVAWAVQAHGGAEGLVSHQIGHALFTLGMGYLLFKLYRMHQAGPGWGSFKAFLWLLILWNIVTFSGHWMNEFVDPENFLRTNGHTVAFRVTDLTDAVYYLTRLDHLFLVPSFSCLLLALKKWSQHA